MKLIVMCELFVLCNFLFIFFDFRLRYEYFFFVIIKIICEVRKWLCKKNDFIKGKLKIDNKYVFIKRCWCI